LFHVYRFDSVANDYVFYDETNRKIFIDTAVYNTNQNYYYKVKVYNSNKIFSEFSDVAYGFIDDFMAISFISVENGNSNDSIKISWEDVKGAEKYHVFRSQSDTLHFSEITIVENNFYLDSNVEKVYDYFYKVKAFNEKLGFTDFSDVVSSYLFEEYSLVSVISEEGYSDNQLDYPYAILFDINNDFYVCDKYNHKIKKFSSNGEFIKTFAYIEYPEGLEWDINGNLVIAESSIGKISIYNLSGEKLESFGDNITNIREIDIDEYGNFYIVDILNHRIQKYDKNKNFILKWGENGNGDGKFDYPWGIECVGNQILVSDKNGVQFFTPNGEFVKRWVFEKTASYITAYNDYIYFACVDHVLKVNHSGKIVAQIGVGNLEAAYGIGFDNLDRLFVVDGHANNIKVFVKN